jgi:hypothetical protein
MRIHVLVHHSLEFGFYEQKFTQKFGVFFLNCLSFFKHFIHFLRLNRIYLALINGFLEMLASRFLFSLKDLDEMLQLRLILDLKEVQEGSFENIKMVLSVVILLDLKIILIHLEVLIVLVLWLLGLVLLVKAQIHSF